VVYPTDGPAGKDLAEAGQPGGRRYHYYIDTTGSILRLVDEARAGRVAGQRIPLKRGTNWQGPADLGQRSVAIGVEYALAIMSDEQVAALSWLLGDLKRRYNLASDRVIQAAEL